MAAKKLKKFKMNFRKLGEKHQQLIELLELQNQYAFETKAIAAEQLRLLQLIAGEKSKKRSSVKLETKIQSPRRHLSTHTPRRSEEALQPTSPRKRSWFSRGK